MRARAKVVHESTGDPSAVMSQFERAFRSVLHRAQSSAERVIVVRQPWFEKETYLPEEEALFWNGGIGKAFKEEITEYFSSKALCTLMGEIDRRAAAISDDMGIRHLDLRGVLKPSAEHYIDHFHFTPAGSEAVAEAVSDAIAEEYQSPQRASPLP